MKYDRNIALIKNLEKHIEKMMAVGD